MDTRFITIEELALVLQVPKSWIYVHARQTDGLPAVRVGKYIRFNLEEVLAWLDKKQVIRTHVGK